jgi:nitrite reductase/ring-hydroxylating ferredoxin subunit
VIPSWWPLALSTEITSTGPTARRCGERDYVLYRDHRGAVRALEDRCAHRRVPLSLGRITDGGALQCGYHGWCYDGATGQCVAITTLDPTERVPARYKVPAFAVRERDGFVYVWDGLATEANEAELPSFAAQAIGEEGEGAALAAVSHEAFAGILLDAPGLVLRFEGLAILPELLGEAQVRNGRVETEYALDVAMPPHRTQSPTDFPFVLHIATRAVTGQTEVSVATLDETCVFTALIAAEPARPSVTALRWRHWNSPVPISGAGQGSNAVKRVAFNMQWRIEPEGLMALRATPAADCWRALSQGFQQSEVPVISESRGAR